MSTQEIHENWDLTNINNSQVSRPKSRSFSIIFFFKIIYYRRVIIQRKVISVDLPKAYIVYNERNYK